jgi:hypothetical protein
MNKIYSVTTIGDGYTYFVGQMITNNSNSKYYLIGEIKINKENAISIWSNDEKPVLLRKLVGCAIVIEYFN